MRPYRWMSSIIGGLLALPVSVPVPSHATSSPPTASGGITAGRKAVIDAQGWLAWNYRFVAFRPSLSEPGYLSLVAQQGPVCSPSILRFSSRDGCKFERSFEQLVKPDSTPLCSEDLRNSASTDTRQVVDLIDYSQTKDVEAAPDGDHGEIVVIHLSGYRADEITTTTKADGTKTSEHRALPEVIKVPKSDIAPYLDAIEVVRAACSSGN